MNEQLIKELSELITFGKQNTKTGQFAIKYVEDNRVWFVLSDEEIKTIETELCNIHKRDVKIDLPNDTREYALIGVWKR